MTNQTSLTEPVSGNMDISVITAGPEYNLSDPIWAINWFDLKSKWLYNVYLGLAVRHVYSVNGRPLFKGRLLKRIMGDDREERELLLIVNYPSPERFLEMIKSKSFQIKSILRVLAVKDFTFGFMKRKDDGDMSHNSPSKYEGKLTYLAHHFKNRQEEFDANTLKDLAASYDVFTHFIGSKSHLIGRRKKNDKLKTAPFFMDGLVLFGAFEESQFHDLIQDPTYQEFVKQNSSNYIGLFKREV